jgi:hypothetical protein
VPLDAHDRKDDDLAGVALPDDVPPAPAKLPRIGKSNDYSHLSFPPRPILEKPFLMSAACRLERSMVNASLTANA